MARLKKAFASFRSVFDKSDEKEKKEKKKPDRKPSPEAASAATSSASVGPSFSAPGRDDSEPPTPIQGLPRIDSAPPTYEEAQAFAGPTGNFTLEKDEKPLSPTARRTPWELAFEALTDEELASLGYDPNTSSESPSLSSAISAIEAKLEDVQAKRWKLTLPSGCTVILRDVVESVLIKTNTYMKVGDIMLQHNPDVTALVWGGVRFLMQAGINDIETFHAVVWNLEAVVGVCGRARLYEGLYSEEKTEGASRVLGILPKLYAAVLRFLAKAVKYFEQNTAGRFTSGIFQPFAITFRPLLDCIREEEMKMDTEARVAADEAQAVERSLSEDRHAELQRRLNSIELLASKIPSIQILESIQKVVSHQEDENRLAILKWLSTIPYLESHKQNSNNRQKGTGAWVLQKDAFKKWKESPKSELLWLHGLPGAGKTVLSSFLIDNICKDPEIPLAYVYCNQKQVCDQTAPIILGTLIKQIVSRAQQLPEALTKLYELHKNLGFASKNADVSELEAVLVGAVAGLPSKNVILIFDALDELEINIRKELYPILKRLREETDVTFKVIVTSRLLTDIKTQLSKGGLIIDIKADDTTSDIRAYIEAEIERVIEEEELLQGDVPTDLLQEIKDTLCANADGMFLWVRYQIPYICAQDTLTDLREALHHMPSTLQETYNGILLTIRSQTPSRIRIAERILRFMMVSTRPLTSKEVLEIAALEPEDEKLDTGRMPRNLEVALGVCGNLVVWDGILDIVRFAHCTVGDFLEAELIDGGICAVNGIVARVCLAVLSFPVDHVEAGGTVSTTAPCEPQILIRNYAAGNWHIHLQQTTRKTESVWKSFDKFVSDKTAFNAWLGTASYLIPSLDYPRFLTRINHNARPNPLFTACHFGLEDAIARLQNQGYAAGDKDSDADDWTQLHVAAGMVSEAAVRKLLELGADPMAKDASQQRIPLHIIAESKAFNRGILATLNHPTAAVTSLLIPVAPSGAPPQAAGVNSRDVQGNTALHHAALACNLSSIRTLCVRGAITTLTNNLGRTALQATLFDQPLLFQHSSKPDTIMHLLCLGSPQDTVGGGWMFLIQTMKNQRIYDKGKAFLKECGIDLDEKGFGTKPLTMISGGMGRPVGNTHLWCSPSTGMWRANVMGTRVTFRARCERWVETGREFG